MSANYVCWEHLFLYPAIQPWPEVIDRPYFKVTSDVFFQ
jgi:hypothetical protein